MYNRFLIRRKPRANAESASPARVLSCCAPRPASAPVGPGGPTVPPPASPFSRPPRAPPSPDTVGRTASQFAVQSLVAVSTLARQRYSGTAVQRYSGTVVQWYSGAV
eukprot:1291283-Pyramimonas_sp.AAC.2